MSAAAYAQSKGARRLCQSCRDRRARFRYRGVVKADRDHTLCFECFRSERERRRAHLLAQAPLASAHLGFGNAPRRTLTRREVEHRRRMLTHLEAASLSRTSESA